MNFVLDPVDLFSPLFLYVLKSTPFVVILILLTLRKKTRLKMLFSLKTTSRNDLTNTVQELKKQTVDQS